MKLRTTRARTAGLVAVGAAALALTACSTANPGDAAVVGDTRISEQSVSEQMRSVNEALGQPADAPSTELARTIVSYNVGYELIQATADTLQVSVPEAQLDQVFDQQIQQVGSEEALRQAAAQQGVPPVNLRRDLRTQLLASAIVSRIAPNGDQAAGQQVLLDAVRETAQSVPVAVAPRYGVWDDEQLQIVPDPDPVSRPEVEPAPALPAQ